MAGGSSSSLATNHQPPATKRVAICIGPEHGTVGPELIKEAAKEAVKGRGFDLLYVLGFAFDPHVDEESKQYGKLKVQTCRMNLDLSMGDELLKKPAWGICSWSLGNRMWKWLVVSGSWLVAGNGRMVANYEWVKELSGLGSLEEINRLGRADLFGFQNLSVRREVWSDQPVAPGGGIGSLEHRRGRGEKRDGGIPAKSQRRQRLSGGSGDAIDHGPSPENAGLPDADAVAPAGGRNQQDAGRAETIPGKSASAQATRHESLTTALRTLTAADFPLSLATNHYSQVTIRGVDVYDPTTGEIRSYSTDDIACWFIDTNYDGESFFVRHAYFTGAQEPYEKLKRALRAEIDEAAWSALYSTVGQPFPTPATGKIAVKVINQYGDEVLKVFSIKAGD